MADGITGAAGPAAGHSYAGRIVMRLFQRQRPGVAAMVGLLGLNVVVRMVLAQANRAGEEAGDWEWAQEEA